MKQTLDKLVLKYKTPAFIEKDPLSFPYRYQSDGQTCEMVAFITALMSYGRRESIFKAMNDLLSRLEGDPKEFILTYTPKRGQRAFKGFVYRFYKAEDMGRLFQQLRRIYEYDGSLETGFMKARKDFKQPTLQLSIHAFVQRFLQGESPKPSQTLPLSNGLKFMLADPLRGGACKRFNMFLRWMVREDNVDLGLWKKALTPAELIIPLDTHVATLSREFGLLQRRANDWQSAETLTRVLQRYSPEDPVQYDFALFGLGVSGDTKNPFTS